MFLALFRNGGFGFGDGNGAGIATQGIETQAQLNAIRTQLQDNQNADCIKSAIQGNGFALSQLAQTLNIDFNTLQKCCCDVQAAIQQVAGQVGFSAERVINAVNLGDCNVIQALQNCCCQTQRQIADFRADIQLQNCKDTGELRNGQRDLGFAITQGFASSAYETQRQTCDILNAGKDNTQRIIDTLNNHWKDEQALQIQDLKFQKSMESLGLTIPSHVTPGDAAYLANMYYADLYPDPLKDEASCLRAAYKVANDPDGYEGMIFCRWTADAIGKAISINWEKFV